MKFPTGKRKIPTSVSLFEQHLAQAIDETRKAQDVNVRETHDDYLIEWRYTTNSILHGISALDSLINYLGYEYFFNENSDHFLPKGERRYALQRALWSWNNLPLMERIKILLDETNVAPLLPKNEKRIQELGELRNWISHGRPFTVIYHHEFIQTDENTVKGIIYDTEQSVNWITRFPITKFNSPASLDKNDAKKAITIILEALLSILAKYKWFHVKLKTFYGGTSEYWFDGNKSVAEVLNRFGLE